MAEDLGNGVTRTLSALQRQFQIVVWQAGKPPLDSELNLMSQVDWERVRELVRSQMHSGFMIDPTAAVREYETHSQWSNFFRLGRQEDETELAIDLLGNLSHRWVTRCCERDGGPSRLFRDGVGSRVESEARHEPEVGVSAGDGKPSRIWSIWLCIRRRRQRLARSMAASASAARSRSSLTITYL